MSSSVRRIIATSSLLIAVGVIPTTQTRPPQGSISDLRAFEARAARFNAVVALPAFETTPKEIETTLANTIGAANLALDRIGGFRGGAVTFDNTVGALDDVRYQVTTAANRLSLIEQTSANATVRDAATAAVKSLQDWMVGIDYRDDVYQSVRQYAGATPTLSGEHKKLLLETLRDYRRAGLDLPKGTRDQVAQWRKELEGLSSDFQNNVTKATQAVKFTKADLDGIPEDFLQQIKSADDEYTVMANVTFHFVRVMENAKREATRKRLELERDNLARNENIPLIEQILTLRARIAKALGYSTWADYSTEVKMAGNARTAMAFLETLRIGLRPKLEAELEEYRRLKVRETGDAAARINVWDLRYYSNLLKKQKYTVDADKLRVYFPYQRVLDGMFAIYQRIFALKFEPIDAPYKWIDALQLYAVSDARSGEPLGLFYLDMFPRKGKYNHFANFGIIEGRRRQDGKAQRPVVALVCNFPVPAPDRPSLLSHGDVATLFHEFGHAIHAILTRSRFARFSAWRVPRDFVEAPSQMLENWVWDKTVLDSFAADYRDPSRKIPPDVLAKLKAARLATEATRYQSLFIARGLVDLALHTKIHEGNAQEALRMSNEVMGSVFLPFPDDTAFLAYFSHMAGGYDAGYYGYAWAGAIAADMATVFEKSPDRYFDKSAGMRLRKEIYEQGDTRDVTISIERFLGRQRSLEPLLRQIGIAPGPASAAGGRVAGRADRPSEGVSSRSPRQLERHVDRSRD